MLHSSSKAPLLLKTLPEETAKFFIKAPDHGILNFILSNKVILVEGDAEYMLMDKFYRTITGKSSEENNIHIMSVGGTSFKRYLDIAKILKIKVAVIRDNDGDYQSTCVDLYSEYTNQETKYSLTQTTADLPLKIACTKIIRRYAKKSLRQQDASYLS